ncbi:hypothetical protein CJ026_026340, partial [Ralstonia pickettii]
ALEDRRSAPGVRVDAVRARTGALTDADFSRGDYAERAAAQDAALHLPALPTTTIGSFPQTGDIRRARARHAKGELTTAEYDGFLRDEIAAVITLQEDLGLDVLVHGEPERNDMVQYFAENLDGFYGIVRFAEAAEQRSVPSLVTSASRAAIGDSRARVSRSKVLEGESRLTLDNIEDRFGKEVRKTGPRPGAGLANFFSESIFDIVECQPALAFEDFRTRHACSRIPDRRPRRRRHLDRGDG